MRDALTTDWRWEDVPCSEATHSSWHSWDSAPWHGGRRENPSSSSSCLRFGSLLLPQERREVVSRDFPALACITGCAVLVAGIVHGGCGDGDKHRSCIISLHLGVRGGKGHSWSCDPVMVACPVPPLSLSSCDDSKCSGRAGGTKGLCGAPGSPESLSETPCHRCRQCLSATRPPLPAPQPPVGRGLLAVLGCPRRHPGASTATASLLGSNFVLQYHPFSFPVPSPAVPQTMLVASCSWCAGEGSTQGQEGMQVTPVSRFG